MQWPESIPRELAGLSFAKIRFVLEAEAEVKLPPYLGSTLRGGLAMAFKRMMCTYGLRPCDGCPVQRSCPYPHLFESPVPTGSQQVRRLRDRPHPLVIEPPLQHPGVFRPGDRLEFGLVLIGPQVHAAPHFAFAASEMARCGLGANRVPFRLEAVFDDGGELLFDSGGCRWLSMPRAATVGERVEAWVPKERVNLDLLTPLRIKHNGRFMSRPFSAPALLKNLVRRFWSLAEDARRLAPDSLDFRPLMQCVSTPEVETARVKWHEWERYSNRQKKKMKLGGVIGSVSLAGEIEPWAPFLIAAEAMHAGKGTVMGLGRIAVR